MKIDIKEWHFSVSKLLWAFSEIPPNFRFTKHAPFYYRLFIKITQKSMKIYTTEKHFPASKLLWAFSEIPPNFRFTKRAPFYYRLFIKCMKNTCEQPSMAFEVQFFFNENNWKLVLVITFRNQRMRKFCKKRWLQLDPMFIVHTEELLNSIKKRDFQRFCPARKTGTRPTTCQNKAKPVISISFSYSQNEKCSYFMFRTLR